jgi:outer membrane biosynthesis protein TonB
MSWRGTILDVEHFVSEKAVTIGNLRRSDFGIPPILGSGQYAIVNRQGEKFTLNLDPKMGGVMQRQGRLQRVDDVRQQAVPTPRGYQVPLEKDDFAKVTLGEVDFYLSFTDAPPRLRMRRLMERDAFFLKILVSSMLLTGVTITGLMTARVPQTLEAEQLPERIATILYQPEKYHQIKPPVTTAPAPKVEEEEKEPPKKVEPPKPKPEPVKLDIKPNPIKTPRPVPKEMDTGSSAKQHAKKEQKKPKASKGQGEAREGAGAKAKGPEGTRGKPKAAPGKEHQTAAARPSPQAGKGAGSGNSQVRDEGNVDLLKGASSKIQNLLGNSAAQLGKGGQRLQGFGAFNTQGEGGLALSGDGKGGGGDAASLGGLSDHGRGGGRVGTGQGAAGNGSGIIGGRTRVAIRSGGPEEAVVMGSIDADAVEAALLAHKDEFRLCYEKEINAEHPYLSGRVGTSFTIGSSGRVTEAGIESSTLKNANAERCIVTVIKRIDFPIPRGGGIVQVTYPFKFSSTGK